jgi:phosphomannomutase
VKKVGSEEQMQSLRIGIAGLRGQVGIGMTVPRAIDFASALGTYIDSGTVVAACDTRISSCMFQNAVISSLLACGLDVIDAGVISAPEMHFAVRELGASAGLLIGAGHHPKGWNAIMPLTSSGAFFTNIQLQELLDVYHSKRFGYRQWNQIGKDIPPPVGIQDKYIDLLCSQLDVDSIASKRFTIVADFCNGSGVNVGEKFAKRLGINMIAINNEASGILPHDPEPRPRSAVQARSVLRPLKADIAFVFNSDMSRTSIVTDSGETLSEEYTIALVADQVLSTKNRAQLVTNSCTTRTLDEIAEKYGAKIHKTKVGEACIIDKMLELGADISGDGSGGSAFKNHIPGYDNFMVLGVILEAMAKKNASSTELAKALPRYHIIKRAFRTSSSHAYTSLHRLRDYFNDAVVDDDDGLRFDWPEGWIHLRASMTEPIVRMIVEWNSKEQAEERAGQVRGILERLAL